MNTFFSVHGWTNNIFTAIDRTNESSSHVKFLSNFFHISDQTANAPISSVYHTASTLLLLLLLCREILRPFTPMLRHGGCHGATCFFLLRSSYYYGPYKCCRIASARNVDTGLNDACRRVRLQETVNWRRRAGFWRARVSSHVCELKNRSELPNDIHLYNTIHLIFLISLHRNKSSFLHSRYLEWSLARGRRNGDGHHAATWQRVNGSTKYLACFISQLVLFAKKAIQILQW
jgi:hypothetical protein